MNYSSEVLADSPLLYAQFEETSGTTVVDSGSLNDTGTCHGSVTRNVTLRASVGVGVTLGGTPADYVSFPDLTSLRQTGDFTFEIVLKSTSFAADQTLMSKGIDSAGRRGYSFAVNSSRQLRILKASTALLGTSSGTIPNDGNAHHLAVTRSGNLYTFYIDGASAGTSTDSTAIDASQYPFSVGLELVFGLGSGDDGYVPVVGSVDEAAVYSTALSGARILAHYNAFAATVYPDANTVKSTTSISAVEQYPFKDASTIASRSVISALESGPYPDAATFTSVTQITSGEYAFAHPVGFWGPYDDDDGII